MQLMGLLFSFYWCDSSCLPCGHLYGFSCIKKWFQQRRSAGKCPQCNRTCSLRDVRKIYASRVAAVDDEAQKRILFLRSKLSSIEQKVIRTTKNIMDRHLLAASDIRTMEANCDSANVLITPTIIDKEDSIEKNFVNNAEIAWHEMRKKWVGDPSNRTSEMPVEPVISVNATYEDLLTSNSPFHTPIPLAEMVDSLFDIWHEDGLFY